MSKTSKNVLGDQRGKIGKVVGKVVEGVQMYSAHTDSVKNPRTVKQVSHRSRFAAMVTMARALKGCVNVGLREAASKYKLVSPCNLFVKANMPLATYDSDSGVVTIDYGRVSVARGEVPGVVFSGVTFGEGGVVTATYQAQGDTPGARDDDSVYLVAYSPELCKSMMTIGIRESGTLTMTLPSEWSGKTVQVWGFVRTSAEDEVPVEAYGVVVRPGCCSDSTYVGSGSC